MWRVRVWAVCTWVRVCACIYVVWGVCVYVVCMYEACACVRVHLCGVFEV